MMKAVNWTELDQNRVQQRCEHSDKFLGSMKAGISRPAEYYQVLLHIPFTILSQPADSASNNRHSVTVGQYHSSSVSADNFLKKALTSKFHLTDLNNVLFRGVIYHESISFIVS
jgi:hypothetical protein